MFNIWSEVTRIAKYSAKVVKLIYNIYRLAIVGPP